MKRLVVLSTREPRRSEAWDVGSLIRGMDAVDAAEVRAAEPDGDVLFVPHAVSEPQPDRADFLALPTISVVTSARWLQTQTPWPPAMPAVPEDVRLADGAIAVDWIRRSMLTITSGPDVAVTLQGLLSDASERIVPCILPTTPPPAPSHGSVKAVGRIVVLAAVHPTAVLPQILQGYLIARARGIDLPPLAVMGPGAAAVTDPHGIGSLFGLTREADVIGLEQVTEAERGRALRDARAIVIGTPEVGLGRDIRDAIAAGTPALVPASTGHAQLLHSLSAWARPFDPYDARAVAAAFEAVFGNDSARYEAAAATGRHDAARRLPHSDAIRAVIAEALDGTRSMDPHSGGGAPEQRREGRLRVAVVVRSGPSVGGVRFLESVVQPACPEIDVTLVLSHAADRAIGSVLPDVPRIRYSRAALESLGADVIWVPWPHLSMPPRTGVPLTCTWHDFNYLHAFGEHARSTWSETHRLREARIASVWFRTCTSVVHSAEAIRAEMREAFPAFAAKSRVVPVAPPPLVAASDLVDVRARFGVTGRFLLTPNGYYPHKNQDLLIRALALGRTEGHDLSVVFTGNRTWELDGRVPGAIGLGMVSDPDLVSLYALADGVVIPSLYEAGSYAMIEALHAGLPVAAADRPAPVEIAHRFGGDVIFFDPEDPRAALDAMCALASGEPIPHVAGSDEGRSPADVAAGYLAVWREAVALRAGESAMS